MFRVKYLPTGSVFTVYGINGLYFLIWNDSGTTGFWEWVCMAECAPE